MPSSDSPAPVAERLRSIDALRGFDMFWIIGGDVLVKTLARLSGGPAQQLAEEQLEHVPWEGFRFYDLIFPLFLFLVGVVLPFSLGAARQRGAGTRALAFKVVRRTLLLFLLALLYNDVLQLKWLHDGEKLHYDLSPLRVLGVLQCIAICYGVAALIVLFTGV